MNLYFSTSRNTIFMLENLFTRDGTLFFFTM